MSRHAEDRSEDAPVDSVGFTGFPGDDNLVVVGPGGGPSPLLRKAKRATPSEDVAKATDWEHIARLVYDLSNRWQEMAEQLMDELMDWHHPSCPSTPEDREAPRADCDAVKSCTCHQPLRKMWDNITDAETWRDPDEDDDDASAPCTAPGGDA